MSRPGTIVHIAFVAYIYESKITSNGQHHGSRQHYGTVPVQQYMQSVPSRQCERNMNILEHRDVRHQCVRRSMSRSGCEVCPYAKFTASSQEHGSRPRREGIQPRCARALDAPSH
jgi:hypothetical protein